MSRPEGMPKAGTVTVRNLAGEIIRTESAKAPTVARKRKVSPFVPDELARARRAAVAPLSEAERASVVQAQKRRASGEGDPWANR